jgi:hypothetical protein
VIAELLDELRDLGFDTDRLEEVLADLDEDDD